MKGTTFDNMHKFHNTYFSDYININLSKKEINYLYTMQSSKTNTDGIGIARFNFYHKDKTSYPTTLLGTTKDKHLIQQCKGFEIKISDEILDATQYIYKSVEVYKEYKNKI